MPKEAGVARNKAVCVPIYARLKNPNIVTGVRSDIAPEVEL